ncbi:MAG: helix-hairpin-helix domain-containing protein [Ignavibacteriales bacterium]|nr:helix-hairpin-helix domain-containing protein [Ignavibacteriales bacterium]MCF8314752.1 helix-hairpin-helix domain-containing protein [Ignavibacteriales bacterium]MCF8438000.1 helix-hairpin-helix domain-containing protein [Ignavibacteriales bacterium]
MISEKIILFCLVIFFQSLYSVSAQSDTTFSQSEWKPTSYYPEAIELTADEADMLADFVGDITDINTADYFDLITIPMIDTTTARLLLQYRKDSGRIFSLSELYSISGIDKQILDNIIPFIAIREFFPEQRRKRISDEKKSQFELRSRYSNFSPKPAEFTNGKYVGSSIKSYSRIRFRNNNITAAATIEKDPGESRFDDHTVYYLSYHLPNELFVIAGNYFLDFGNGMMAGRAYSFGNNFETGLSRSISGKGFQPYTGSAEYNYLAGFAGGTTIWDKFSLSVFYSKNRMDARYDSIAMKYDFVFTGYHRTETELLRRKNIRSEIFGGIFSFRPVKNLNLSILGVRRNFSEIILPVSDNRNIANYSTALSYTSKLFRGSGEFLPQNNSGSFFGLIRPANGIIFMGGWFKYNNNTDNLFGRSFLFGENEESYYGGIAFSTVLGNLKISQFSVLSADNETAASSKDKVLTLSYDSKLTDKITILLKYSSISHEMETKRHAERIERIRPEITFYTTNSLRIKLRGDLTIYRGNLSVSRGSAFSFDAKILPVKKLTFFCRLTFYKTADYDSRIYIYENDFPGVFTSVMHYGSGLRWYFQFYLDLLPNLSISAKYSERLTDNNDYAGMTNEPNDLKRINWFSLQFDYNPLF